MANKDNIFSKHLPNIKLATRFDADGKEIAVEIRKDDEQLEKCQEIIDLLVAAGYFRARIKGLSNFDKIVGGISWCIEASDYDVDVDLLFNENLNIKQKIALTEKIVAVLELMDCPHTIEPHQIQGNDFINIFPVIQWLVKKSVENRAEKAEKLKRFAIGQFHNEFKLESDKQQKEKNLKVLKNVRKVQDAFAPKRQYKKKDSPPDDEKTRVRITLLEYGNRGNEIPTSVLKTVTLAASVQTQDDVENGLQDEIDVETLLQVLAATQEADDYEIAAEELSEAEQIAIQKHYDDLKTEMTIDGHQLSEKNKLKVILLTKIALEKKLEKILQQNQQLAAKVNENKETLAQIALEKEQLENEIKELDEFDLTKDESGIIKQVQELVIENENLKKQEVQFKEQCKKELGELQQKIKDSEDLTPDADVTELQQVLEKEKLNLQGLRLQLAKKNRQSVAAQRQLDNIPDRTELSQYQRRFLELYNQVSAKHRETKQFYTLYNTLEDTKRYLEKEMSILNSIYDNYHDAMQTPHAKEQFMLQFEQIVEGIKQTKVKVKSKCDEEKLKRDHLNGQLLALVDQQRKYAAAIKQFTSECQRNEALHLKLKSMML